MSVGLQAQVADDSTGVSVAIKAIGGYEFDLSPSASLNLSISGLNGTQSAEAEYPNMEVPQIMARLAVGKTYNLQVQYDQLDDIEVQAVPPPGYVMEMDGVPREHHWYTYIPVSIRLRVRPAADAAPARAGVATALGTERTLWQVSLGALSTGESAGAISFIDVGAASSVASIFSPEGLVYDSPSTEVQVFLNGAGAQSPYVPGTIRQVIAPQVCVDVYLGGQNQCELKFYHRSQLGSYQGNGFYTFTGDPFAWYFFNQDGVQPNAVRISCDLRNVADPNATGYEVRQTKVTTLVRSGSAPNYSWTARDWALKDESPLSEDLRQRNGSTETLTSAIPGQSPAIQNVRAYASYPWGEEVTTETLGTTNAIVTQYGYWSDVGAQSASYTRLRSRLTHGEWDAYEYYDYTDGLAMAGALHRQHRPFNSSSTSIPNLASHNGEVVTYEWNLDAFGRASRLARMETRVAGVTTATAEIDYAEAAAGFTGHPYIYIVTATRSDDSGSGVLTSQTRYLREDAGIYPPYSRDDFFRNRIHSVQRADGVKQSFAYQRGTWNGSAFSASGNGGLDAPDGVYASRTSVITGSASSGTLYSTHDGYDIDDLYLVDGKSTLEVTLRDNYARVVRTESHVRSGGAWHLLATKNYQWNLRNQLVKRASNESPTFNLAAGAIYEASHEGENLVSEIDETGLVMSYEYDTAGRVDTATRAAAGVTVLALKTKFVYNALDQVTQQIVGYGQSETLVSGRGYDDAGRVTSESSPGPNGAITTSYIYNPSARQVTASLPNGGTRVETYQPDGNVHQVTGTAVVPSYFTYAVQAGGVRYSRVNLGSSGSPRLSESWTDWLGRTTKTSRPGFTGQPAFEEQAVYDAGTGRLAKTTRTGFAATLYGYDALSQPIRSGLDLDASDTLDLSSDRIADADQYFEYTSSAWWLTKVSRTYPTAGSSTALTVSTTRQRLTGFTGNLRAETISTDVDGNTTTQTTSIDRPNKTTTIVTTTSGLANPQTETYVNGLPTSVTRFDGLTYATGYDALGRRSTSTDPRTGTTTLYYKTGSAYVWWIKDPANNAVATYAYDDAGRVVTTTNADNQATYTAYNTLDQVVRQWGAAANPVEYGYNALGERETMKTYRGGSGWSGSSWPASPGTADWTRWEHDTPSGLLAAKYDAANLNVTTGQPIASPKKISFTYNSRGQTATRTWARGVTTTYGYDPSTGELLTQTYAGGAATSGITYAYTRAGQLDEVTDVTGTRTFVYNPSQPLRLDALSLPAFYANRVQTRQYDSVKRSTGFQLGTTGNLAGDMTQTHAYHATTGRFDNIISASSAQAARTFSYGYKANSSLVETLGIAGSAFSVTRNYEPNRDLLTAIDSKWNATSRTRYDYTHNPLGQRATAKQSGDVFADFGGSTYYRYAYNARGEVTEAVDYQGEDPASTSSPQLAGRRFGYSYDPIGNRSSATRALGTGVSDLFTPNALNQYVSRENNVAYVAGTARSDSTIAVTGGTATSGVGRAGRYWGAQVTLNNTSGPAKADLTVTATLAGPPSLLRTETKTAFLPAAAQSFTYDDDGNLTGDGLWTYVYDAENRLITMTATSAAKNAGYADRLLEFKYDYLGRRVQKRSAILSANGGFTPADSYRRYLYDGWNLVAEFDATSTTCGALSKSFTWGLDLAGSLSATGGVGALVQISDHSSSTAYFPTYDGNGNVAALLRASDGFAVAKYEYSPFGELLRAEGAYAASNPFRFSTKFTDDESGLVYYGQRYYSPSLGRFINRDPIAEQGGLNLYGFCGNDGVNQVDVLGNGILSKLWDNTIGKLGKALRKLERWSRKHVVGATLLSAVFPIMGPFAFASQAHATWEVAKKNPRVAAVVAAIATWYIGGWGATALGWSQTAVTVTAGASAGFGGSFVGARASGASLSDSFRAGYQGAAWGGGLALFGAQFLKAKYAPFSFSSAAHQYVTSEVRHYVGQFVEKQWGIDAWAFNGSLLAMSFLGEYGIGSRIDESRAGEFAENTGGRAIRGIFSRGDGELWRQIAGAPADLAEIILGYQGLPTASGLRYVWSHSRVPTVTGESNGAIEVSNLRAFGMVPEGSFVQSLPAGIIAPAGLSGRINLRDFVSGFGFSKLLNPNLEMKNFGDWWNPVTTHFPDNPAWRNFP